ncbi:uncharacterized protein LOC119496950 [Sebastes umbrosus]|uniref:uncharacterized protein LOC119496950 n=1 Tax=Sebastes umbrosus TaxID=72105 RepID=UPI00189DC854|nr:uncharacterized protein LOC119496950 [Sebastes umbrosus]
MNHSSVLLLLLLLGTCSAYTYQNVALRGKATQSDRYLYAFGAAYNAIDGNRDSNFGADSCTHTDGHTNPWWRVDLLESYIVTSVIITNRGDCCAERLDGAEVHIGNSLQENGAANPVAAVIPNIPAGRSLKMTFTRLVEGRYVTVVLPGLGRVLTLCEVEVYGYRAPTVSSLPPEVTLFCREHQGKLIISADVCKCVLYAGENLALQGKATQSSLHSTGIAYNAIDGNRAASWSQGSCSHTGLNLNPWWRLDLGKTHKVFSVNITNYSNEPFRINGAEILIGDSLENNGNNNPRCAVISSIPGGFTKTFQCNRMDGRYVNIVIPGRSEYLVLSEVEVYGSRLDRAQESLSLGLGSEAFFSLSLNHQTVGVSRMMKLSVFLLMLLLETCSAITYENVALRGKATQSDRYEHAFSAANSAIDGNRESTFYFGSCTHTDEENNPWWRVDLLESYIVTSVIITNRGDCCQQRLNGAEVHIGNSLQDNGAANPVVGTVRGAKQSYTLTFTDRVEGRYVSVVLPGRGYLTLCEVEVYGYRAPTGENLALQGKASQSSLYMFGTAYNAIDGNPNSHWEDGSCTHTKNNINPWWRLDLQKTHKVFSVKITNRDEDAERLNGAEIRIGDSLANYGNNNTRCAVITSIPSGGVQEFECNGMDGRYVNIVIPGREEFLSLCEVEVYGSRLDFNCRCLKAVPVSSDPEGHTSQLTLPGGSLIDLPGLPAVAMGGVWDLGKNFRYIPAHEIAKSLGPDKSKALPVLHAFTGCDIVSIFATMSKKRAWDTWGANDMATEAFMALSKAPKSIREEVIYIVERFPILLYERTSSQLNIDEVCLELFTKKGRGMEKIPPIKDALVQHLKRAVMMILSVFLLLLLLETCSAITYENVALRGKATQSDRYEHAFGAADSAIDGNRESNFHSGSCTHTDEETNPWWRVDLLESYIVTSVIITNRGDCCQQRLNGAEVHIGNLLQDNGAANPVCALITSIPAGDTVEFQCSGGMDGRYVTIVVPGREEYLTLCEVEVYGYRLPTGVNLALQGEASQSSVYFGADASRAINGKKNTCIWGDESLSITNEELNPWWRLDLHKTHKVFSVKITNRAEDAPERINGAEIRIGDDLVNHVSNPRCALITSIQAGATVEFQCSGGMDGRYVTVVIPGREELLTLCEVEVYGYQLPTGVNLALQGEASQSSVYYGADASNAINGKKDTCIWGDGSLSVTNGDLNPWWRLDLRKTHKVFSVNITNRAEAVPERINGAEIRIGDDLVNHVSNPRCALITSIPAGATVEFQCSGGMDGRYVTIVIPGREEYLTLCEVEVYGYRLPTGVNLALHGEASQSSVYFGAVASNAINGKKNTCIWGDGSLSVTNQELNPWWRLDLRKTHKVFSVKITNRFDDVPERINGAEIRIGDDLVNHVSNPRCALITSIPAGATFEFQCSGGMDGRYVTIVIPGRAELLTLCEVEVYGYRLPTGVNLALQGEASQSSVYQGAVASNAINGKKNTCIWGDGSLSVTNQELNPWWRLDLRKTHKVFSVNITNRAEDVPERINGAEIRIGDDLVNHVSNPRCALITSIPAGATVEFQCSGGMDGRYVTIVIPGRAEFLTLCEVEVYGSTLD